MKYDMHSSHKIRARVWGVINIRYHKLLLMLQIYLLKNMYELWRNTNKDGKMLTLDWNNSIELTIQNTDDGNIWCYIYANNGKLIIFKITNTFNNSGYK